MKKYIFFVMSMICAAIFASNFNENGVLPLTTANLAQLNKVTTTTDSVSNTTLAKNETVPSSSNRAATILVNTQQAIAQAFQAMDDWVRTAAVYHNVQSVEDNTNLLYDNNSITLSDKQWNPVMSHNRLNPNAQVKIVQAQAIFNQSLAQLEAQFGVSMKPMSDAITNAFEYLTKDSSSNITTANDITTVRYIVNSAKIALFVPLYSIAMASAVGVGAATGAVGGAVVGLGAGINRIKNNATSQVNAMYSENGDFSIQKAAMQLPSLLCVALKDIVAAPLLAAYAAVEGVVVGAVTGARITHTTAVTRNVGRGSLLSEKTLDDNEDKSSVDFQENAMKGLVDLFQENGFLDGSDKETFAVQFINGKTGINLQAVQEQIASVKNPNSSSPSAFNKKLHALPFSILTIGQGDRFAPIKNQYENNLPAFNDAGTPTHSANSSLLLPINRSTSNSDLASVISGNEISPLSVYPNYNEEDNRSEIDTIPDNISDISDEEGYNIVADIKKNANILKANSSVKQVVVKNGVHGI